MKNFKQWFYIMGLILSLCACKKTDFLGKKPITNITTPTTLTDFQELLDNATVMNYTDGLSQLSCDDYAVSFADWQTGSATERNGYIWAKDIYAGDVGIRDWNYPYQQVFYANSVLEGLAKSDSANSAQGQFIKGWALFTRAFAFYDLTRTFCKSYEPSTAKTDLGIPLRLKSGIDYTLQRSTLAQSFDQIFSDLSVALPLLSDARPSNYLNRPSKLAVYALLARIYLDMRDYTNAESYADKCLSAYNTLIDYNTVNQTANTPFSATNDELIYNARQVAAYGLFTPATSNAPDKASPDLITLYSSNDLRLSIYFKKAVDGTYIRKRGYYGSGSYAFTGLATDEIYLIKAECLAHRNQTTAAMDELNQLLVKRYSNASLYINLTASSPAQALMLVLTERRKELPWRGLRWFDIKRLNAGGANITLTRVLNGTTYKLAPNSPLYALPIPDDEIALSGIQQNVR
eukprot:gene10934-11017_t